MVRVLLPESVAEIHSVSGLETTQWSEGVLLRLNILKFFNCSLNSIYCILLLLTYYQ